MFEEQAKPVGLITSGAFCPPEISAEFGQIPPSFLPHSQRRLYEAQVELLGRWCDSIYLSLPESFVVPSADLEIFKSLNVGVLRVPDGDTLVSSISRSLSELVCQSGVYILHGDTLLFGVNGFALDSFAVAPEQGNYSWGLLNPGPNQTIGKRPVLAGLFSFSNVDSFREILESIDQVDRNPTRGFVES